MTRNRVYLIIQTVLCVGVAVLLCLSVIRLYGDGVAARESSNALAWIFTPERIAAQFARIALPFFGAVGFMIAGLVLGIKDPSVQVPVNEIERTRDLLAARVHDTTDEMRKERLLQKRFLWIGWILFGLCMIPVLLYVIDPGHFPPDDLEHMFSSLLLGILPWTALGLGCVLLFSVLRGRSMGREAELLKGCREESMTGSGKAESAAAGSDADGNDTVKAQITTGAQQGTTEVPPDGADDRRKRRVVMWVRIIVLAAAAAMIVAGALNGSLRDVLIKAINLCTECVGLG